jgi:lysophospholipase L1-like esterase
VTPRPRRRFVALGDSYTIGEGVAPPERWPAQLVERLRREGIEIEAPEIIATTGWTTDELWAGMDRASPAGDCAIVSLLIGVNNQYRGRSADDYRSEFRKLLDRAVALARMDASRVIVLAIPDWGVTSFAAGRNRAAIAHAIDAFNTVNREETLRRGARYVDIADVSRSAGSDATLTAEDGLHPSGRLYGMWVDVVLPVARDILRADA